jgi:alkaline phosphatase
MPYVDGFVIAVPRRKMKAYEKMAREGRKMWMKLGALDYKECVADDIKAKWGTTPFSSVMKLKPGETVVFSYILYKSRAHRDRVNAKIMQGMKEQPSQPSDMPFAMKRMTYGGFRVIVSS